MKKIHILFLIGMILAPICINAQSELPVFVGKIKSVNRKENSFLVKTENATAEIVYYSPTIIRIRYSRTELKDDFSYAVIQSPGKGLKEVSDQRDSLVLATDSLNIVILKDPFLVTVKNLHGEVISQDQPGLPVSSLGTEVTCYKKLFTDEKFLGLGLALIHISEPTRPY